MGPKLIIVRLQQRPVRIVIINWYKSTVSSGQRERNATCNVIAQCVAIKKMLGKPKWHE